MSGLKSVMLSCPQCGDQHSQLIHLVHSNSHRDVGIVECDNCYHAVAFVARGQWEVQKRAYEAWNKLRPGRLERMWQNLKRYVHRSPATVP